MEEFLTVAGPFGVNTSNDCHIFGLTWGCRSHCPAFLNGECEVFHENLESKNFFGEMEEDEFLDAIESYGISDNDAMKLIENYLTEKE